MDLDLVHIKVKVIRDGSGNAWQKHGIGTDQGG